MKNKKQIITFIFILISTLFVSIPLFNFNIQYDDGIQHICRLIETMKSFKCGNFFPVIMQGLCNGFGYSWNLFYSPLTAYLPLLLRIFSFSYENCLRIFMFLCSIASGYAMYFFMQKILRKREIDDKKKNYIAILGACLYIMAPYRLTDMYIRVAVAEYASFIFIPIIFNGLYTIINLKEKSNILAYGVIGLILTHSLITFYTAIYCVIYVIVNIKEIKKNEFLRLLKNILISLGVTAFYIFPLIESKFSADYEVFNISHMLRENVLVLLKIKPKELLFIEQDRMAYFIGIPVIIGVLLSLVFFIKKSVNKNYVLFLVMGLISVLLTLDFIPFEKFPNVFRMMQFSFRLLEFSSFFLTVIASINLGLIFKNFDMFYLLVIIAVMADLLIPIKNNIDFSNNRADESVLIEGVDVTEGTGRVHAGCASFEYLPTKAFQYRDYIVTREDTAIVLEGDAQIFDFEKDKTNCKFKISGSGKIELPYIYYIGYSASIDGKNIKITESENGFCQIEVNNINDLTEVKVSYTGTIGMKISVGISFITCVLLISMYWIDKKKAKI